MPVISGEAQLRELGLRLKAAGDGGLRRELLKGIRVGASPLIRDVRAAALNELPKRGGLAARTASSPIAVRTRLTGSSVGVRIVNTRKNASTGGTSSSIRFGTDTGKLRHPVFGTDKWVTQQLATPGWFTKTLTDRSPEVAPDVLAAMNTVARAICLPL